jgi:flagellar biosynthesis anti-sigma factor FlgM
MRISAIRELFNPEIRKADSAGKKNEPAKSKASSSDHIEFSSNAQRLSGTKAQVDIIASQLSTSPDIRTEKVAEVKQKISEGFYNSPEFTDKLAEKLALEFGAKRP